MSESTKKPEVIQMISDEEGMIINFAVRYAIGRQTYAPSAVIQYVTPRLHLLKDPTLVVLYNDMNSITKTVATSDFYFPLYKQFFAAIKAELDKREYRAVRPDNGLYDSIRITNADRIRMMTDEELCSFIGNYIRPREICDDLCGDKCGTSNLLGCVYRDENGNGDILLGWLKEEAKQQ